MDTDFRVLQTSSNNKCTFVISRMEYIFIFTFKKNNKKKIKKVCILSHHML